MSQDLDIDAMLSAALTDQAQAALDGERLKEFQKFQREREKLEKAQRELEQASPEERSKFEAWLTQQEHQRAADIPQARLPEPSYPYAETFGMDPRTATPEGYKVTYDGVFARLPEGDRWVRICLAPLVVTAAYIDAQGEQSVELAWRSRGAVVRRLVPRSLIRRGRKLVETLGDAGLPVMEADARAVERWLGEFEVANISTLPSEYVARWLGWQPDGTFVTGPDDGAHLAPLYDDQQRAANSYRPSGSAEKWREAVAGLEVYPAARAIVAAAFAPVLLAEFREPSFMVDISFTSTSGKTTCLRCAMSAWADPSERAGVITSWNTTPMAMETKLNLVRGVPSALDDTMLARYPELIGETPYTLSMDRGKSRGGQYVSGLEWQTVLLSTGEQSVLSHTKGQGASVRALALQRRPLGEGAAALAENLTEVTSKHYGHAGPEFVRRYRELLADPGKRERLHSRRDALVASLRGDTAITGRRAPKVALLAIAEELACDWKILPYQAMDIAAWQEMFVHEVDETDNRPEQAMETIRAHVAANYASLYDSQATQTWIDGAQRQPPGGWLGVIRRSRKTGVPQVALHPDRVREILKRADISYEGVIKGWQEAGYLQLAPASEKKDKDKLTSRDYLIVVALGEVRQKCLVFTEKGIPLGGDKDEDE